MKKSTVTLASPEWPVNGSIRELIEVTGYTTVDGDLIVRGVFADVNGIHVRSVYAGALTFPAVTS